MMGGLSAFCGINSMVRCVMTDTMIIVYLAIGFGAGFVVAWLWRERR